MEKMTVKTVTIHVKPEDKAYLLENFKECKTITKMFSALVSSYESAKRELREFVGSA